MTDPNGAQVLTDADINDIAEHVTAPTVDPRARHIPNGTVAALIAMLRETQAERDGARDALHKARKRRDKARAKVDAMRGAAYAEAVERYAAEMAERARIRSMEIRNGTFSLSLEDAQEMTAAYVATARTMLGDAENYSETCVDFPAGKVELELKLAGEVNRYVFTVQRAGKLTPHEARIQAEAERDAMRDLLGSIWLYVGWRSATRSLTTEQRELWADAVDAKVRARQIEDGEDPHPVAERWWRDDA